MANVNLPDIAKQKLKEIRALVSQFQALESDLRDTFEQMEIAHQNEISLLKSKMGLHTSSSTQISDNPYFGASQLHQNPLSKISQQQQQQQQQNTQLQQPSLQQQQGVRNPSKSMYQTQSVDMYQDYQPHRQSMGQQGSFMQPIQPRAHTGSMGGSISGSMNAFPSPQPPPPQNPANRGYHQPQNASQPHYNASQFNQQQQNRGGYHKQKSQSNGVPIGQRHPPPPNMTNHGSNFKRPLPQNPNNGMMNGVSGHTYTHSDPLTESPEDISGGTSPTKKGNKFQALMGKFNGNNNNNNNTGNTSANVADNDDSKDDTALGMSGGISERDFYKKYWIEAGKIGEGAFARVRKITRKSDKAVFALKMIKKKGKSSEDIAALQREILVLQKCDHENIVRLGDWCDTKKRIYMVVEFCDGGDVFERVVQYKKFSEKSAIHVIKAVCSGLQHVHSMGYVHRDLKPDNLMYHTKKVDSKIKIIDFGLAGDCNLGPCKTPCGTAHYAAPEVLNSLEYDQSADMWSLGVIIYTLLCGFPPFFDASNNMKNLYHLIKKGQYSFPSPFWDDISDDAKDLIKMLLVKDPKERLTAEEVLEHSWVVNEDEAADDDLGGQYVKQMSHWQSTRQATEFGLGKEAPPPPPPDAPISLYYTPDQMAQQQQQQMAPQQQQMAQQQQMSQQQQQMAQQPISPQMQQQQNVMTND